MSLTKEQFYRNSIWTFIELTSYPILVVFSTPFFILKLGIENYGLWMLVNTITQGINLLNIGVGDSSINLISKYRLKNQLEAIQKVFRFNFSLSIFLFFCSLIVGWLFYQFNFIALFYQSNHYEFANSLLLLTCFSAGIKIVEVFNLSIFKAYERFDLYSKLSLISKSSQIALAVVLLLFNFNLISILIGTLVINALNLILQFYFLNEFEDHILQLPYFTFLKDKNLYLKYNFWYWLQSSIGLIGFLADKLVVAKFTNVKTLGYYYIASIVGTNIHNFFMAFGSFIFPRVAYKLAAEHNIKPLYYISRAIVAIVGWFIIFILMFAGKPLFEIWLGPDTFEKSIYFIDLYLVYIAGLLLIITPFHFINGSQSIQLNSFFEILLRVSNFLCMLIGNHYFGVNGILYGIIFSTFLNIPLQYFYFHSRVLFLKDISWLLVLIPVVFLLGYLLAELRLLKIIYCLGFLLSTKLIYYDVAKKNIGNSSLFRGFKTKV